jgi:1,4-alpha-glucan branching enzyme
MPLPGETSGRSTVRFVLVAPYASRVSLVGDFNRWNPRAMPMRRSADGRAWLLDVPLAAGRHVYSFVVDGDLAPDPTAPRSGDDDFGVPSSVVLVSGPKT